MNDMNNLKDVILQTLEEIEKKDEKENIKVVEKTTQINQNDKQFLITLREKLLILFEGLQSPDIKQVEQKLDLTINFLEFALSQIDKKINE